MVEQLQCFSTRPLPINIKHSKKRSNEKEKKKIKNSRVEQLAAHQSEEADGGS